MKYIVNPFNGEIDYVGKDASVTLITDVISELDATHKQVPSPKAVKDYVERILGESGDIPCFSGIIEDAVKVTNNTAYSRDGAVYFARKAIIEDAEVQNIFVYKIRESYYRSWYGEARYMNIDEHTAIENRLFECDGQQYVYCDGYFGLLKNVFKTRWEKFNI